MPFLIEALENLEVSITIAFRDCYADTVRLLCVSVYYC